MSGDKNETSTPVGGPVVAEGRGLSTSVAPARAGDGSERREGTHDGRVNVRNYSPCYGAECSCGWTGQSRHMKRTADFDHAVHVGGVEANAAGKAHPKPGDIRPSDLPVAASAPGVSDTEKQR